MFYYAFYWLSQNLFAFELANDYNKIYYYYLMLGTPISFTGFLKVEVDYLSNHIITPDIFWLQKIGIGKIWQRINWFD